ncbi:LexA family protein [Lutibacter sp.]|uniref:LexA family protein n=1 Tax=Lutibacter sp. TaxID=1925666 RepID=UPI003562C146
MRLKKIIDTNNLTIYSPEKTELKERPIVNEDISAGFPSPAEDFKEVRISLDKELVKNEEATFYARVRGNSMIDANIEDGDLLVIDRSIETRNGKIAVCMIDGEFTIKRLKVEKDCVYLMPENKNYKPIKVTEGNDLIVWGIVIYVIKKV